MRLRGRENFFAGSQPSLLPQASEAKGAGKALFAASVARRPSPSSAFARSLAQMVRDPGVCAVIRNVMQEVEAVAHKLGMELPVSIDQRIAGAEKVGEHKTSMLQDLEAGRPMELEALVGAVVELGERVGLPMHYTRTVYSCTRLLAESNSAATTA